MPSYSDRNASLRGEGKMLMKMAVRQTISDYAQTYRQAENEGDDFAKSARAVLAALMLKVNAL